MRIYGLYYDLELELTPFPVLKNRALSNKNPKRSLNCFIKRTITALEMEYFGFNIGPNLALR